MSGTRFYFHLLKVTIVQMLKAHGFDRASDNHVLELLTDLAIRYIFLLSRTIQKYMSLRDDEYPIIKDITNAFLDLGVICPSKRLDKYDIEPVNDFGVESFEKWFNHDMNTRMREVARPSLDFLEERKKTKKKSHAISSKMDDLTKALNEQSKQAQLHNPTMPYLPPPSIGGGKSSSTLYYAGIQPQHKVEDNKQSEHDGIDDIDYDIPPHAVDEDWIQYLIRDQIALYLVTSKLLQNNNNQSANIDNQTTFKPTMLKGTVLEDYVPRDLMTIVNENSKSGNNDFLIAGPMPENLLHTFPYYKSDDESSDSDFDDDISSNNSADIQEHSEFDNNNNTQLAAYDYYEHHKIDEDEMEDVDLYGESENQSHDLNLFG